METQVEDEDAEREEEESVCDEERGVDDGAWSGNEAIHRRRDVGFDGGNVRTKKSVIGGGRRVHRHLWKRKRHHYQMEKMMQHIRRC